MKTPSRPRLKVLAFAGTAGPQKCRLQKRASDETAW
jgi:hypothetical protein